jgi:nicotinamidase-related amidase
MATSTKPALFVVDLQQGPLRSDERLEQLARDVASFATERRDQYSVVIASAFRNEPGSTYDRLIGDDLRDPEDVAMVPDIEDVADVVVESSTYSSLTPRAQQVLVDADVREVHVVGIDTDQCVLATVFALFDAGYEPRVLEDLVTSASGETCHDAGLVALRRAIGEDRVAPA